MAIQKSKTLSSGVTVNYWRIMTISFDRQNFKASAHIALFKDKATSDAGGAHLGCSKMFSFSFSVPELLAAPNAIAWAYSKIIEKAETLITVDLQGRPLETPIPTDADLAGGTPV